MTNFDRIRQADDEQLKKIALEIAKVGDCFFCPYGIKNNGHCCTFQDCADHFTEWLKQEVEDDE